jgi:hypothetical protein
MTDAAPRPKKVKKKSLAGRSGRLSREFWMLKEGMMQGVRVPFNRGSGTRDWREAASVAWLVSSGYMESRPGPLGKSELEYTTTGDGAFAMMVAEGIAASRRAAAEKSLPKNLRRRARRAAARASAFPQGADPFTPEGNQ